MPAQAGVSPMRAGWVATRRRARREKLAKDYEGRALVKALDASADEIAEEARAALKPEGATLPVHLDPDGHAADVFGTDAIATAGKDLAAEPTRHDGCRSVRKQPPSGSEGVPNPRPAIAAGN
jgi:hypothetical protein